MAVTYHAGRRIQGTSTDFNNGIGIPATAAGWKFLDKTTLGSAGDTISVTGLDNKRYYMFLTDAKAVTDNLYPELEVNGDATTNYGYRREINGVTAAAGSYKAMFPTNTPCAVGETYFSVGYIANLANKQKLGISHDVFSEASSSTNAPSRQAHVSKWNNTTDSINRLDMSEDGSGEYASGSELVVLGYDPDDTHTTNFWEELTTKTSTSEANTLTTDTVTAKKYNWVQVFIPYSTGSANNFNIQLGNSTIDGNANYCQSYSIDGATEGQQIEQNYIRMAWNISTGSEWLFANIFFINNANTEKLIISHSARSSTTGSGEAPHIYETVGKWDNVTNQANILRVLHQTGASNLGTGTIIKWWGAD